MAFYLQSPAGDIATFEKHDTFMVFACGSDVIELPVADARKVWHALTLCQYQQVDREGVQLYQSA